MEARCYILATAGHIDHGKSALVEALTGARTMRLPEERARGITIDLGFAHLDVPPFSVGMIDVPGHEDFVKNMVAGIGSIDVALLVVAADDGWMPQTEEHLQILSYLGVTRGVVALSKIDLVQDESAVIAQIRSRLLGSALSDAPIVATSTVSGRGVDELRRTLVEILHATPAPADIGKPRLPIDRVFRLKGVGTVVTGTLSGGPLHVGQEVLVQPGGVRTRIRSIQSHNRTIDAAGPGRRVALNLPDVRPRSSGDTGSEIVQRGQAITVAEAGSASSRWDVLVERLDRETDSRAGRAALKSGALVHVHHGSADQPARIRLLESEQLRPGERALAQIRFDEPAFALAGDRFVVRDWSARRTLAGGVVLDPHGARAAAAGDDERQVLMWRRAGALHDASVWVETELAWRHVVERRLLLRESRFADAAIDTALRHLGTSRRAIIRGELVIEPATWEAAKARAIASIDAAHRAHPDQPGATLLELRKAATDGHTPPLFDLLVAELCQDGFLRRGTFIGRRSHQPRLPQHLADAAQRIMTALQRKPLEPPGRKELVPDPLAHQAMKYLMRTQQVVQIGPELVLLHDALEEATRSVVEHLSQHGSATASELRQVLGTTRRIMVPLLEYLDQHGVSLREGDLRRLRDQAVASGAAT